MSKTISGLRFFNFTCYRSLRSFLITVFLVLIFVPLLHSHSVKAQSIAQPASLSIEPGKQYKIVSAQNGLVLDLSGWDTSNGAKIDQWEWLNQDNQKWTFEPLSGADSGAYRIHSLLTGKCIVVLYASKEDGGKIVQYDCNNTDNEKWWFSEYNGNQVIWNKYSGKVLDIPLGKRDWGLQMQQYTWNEGPGQQWQITQIQTGESVIVDPAKQYKIVSAQNGLVVDLSGWATENEAKIDQWEWLNQDNQKWVFEPLSGADAGTYLIKSVYSNKCLVVSGGSVNDEAKIVQYDCNYTDNGKWYISFFGGNYVFRNKHSGKVLDVPYGLRDWGLQLWQYTWNEGPGQQWLIVEAQSSSQVNLNTEIQYKIVSAQSGLVVDLYNWATGNDAPIAQWEWLNQDNQKWTIEPLAEADAGFYRIHSVYTNKCMVVQYASQDDGGKIIQHDCNNTDNEKWKFTPFNGNLVVTNKYSNKVLDVPFGSQDFGLQLQQYTWNQSPNQQWLITPATQPVGKLISQILAPVNGQTVIGPSLTINVNASEENASIVAVEFYALYDGNWHLINTDSISSYTFDWNIPSEVRSQKIILTIHVKDTNGNIFVDPAGYVEIYYQSSIVEVAIPENKRFYLNQNALGENGNKKCGPASITMLLASNGAIGTGFDTMKSVANNIWDAVTTPMLYQVPQQIMKHGTSLTSKYYYDETKLDDRWNIYKTEILAGRPVILDTLGGVMTGGGHYILGVGYKEDPSNHEKTVYVYDPYGEHNLCYPTSTCESQKINRWKAVNTTDPNSQLGKWVAYPWDQLKPYIITAKPKTAANQPLFSLVELELRPDFLTVEPRIASNDDGPAGNPVLSKLFLPSIFQ